LLGSVIQCRKNVYPDTRLWTRTKEKRKTKKTKSWRTLLVATVGGARYAAGKKRISLAMWDRGLSHVNLLYMAECFVLLLSKGLRATVKADVIG
jgi:hypothetical protein